MSHTRRERYFFEARDPESGEVLMRVYSAGDPSADPRNYLHTPTPATRTVKIWDGHASIGEMRLRVIDKRQDPADQGTGYVTGVMGAYDDGSRAHYNRLLRKQGSLWRALDGGAYQQVYQGVIERVTMPSATTYEISIKDVRTWERGKVFTTEYGYHPELGYGANSVIFHRRSHEGGRPWFDFGELEGIGKVDAIEEHWVRCTVVQNDWETRMEIEEGDYLDSTKMPIFASGDALYWVNRAEIILARPDGNGGWIMSEPMILGAANVQYDTIIAPRFDDPPPAEFAGGGRRLIVRAAGTVASTELPLHIGLGDGIHPITLLRQLLDGTHGGANILHHYDTLAIDRLEQDLDPLTGQPLAAPFPRMQFKVTGPEDRIKFIEDNILYPFGLWPHLLPDGRVQYRSLLSLSLDRETWPAIEISQRAISGASYQQGLSLALNEIVYALQRLTPAQTADGLDASEARLEYLAASQGTIGKQGTQEIKVAGWVVPSDEDDDDPVDDLAPYADKKFSLLQWGPYEAHLTLHKVDPVSGHNPRDLIEGDVVMVDADVLPSLADGRRGLYGRMLVTEVRETKSNVEVRGIVWAEELRKQISVVSYEHVSGDTVALVTDWSNVPAAESIEYEISKVVGDTPGEWQGVRQSSEDASAQFAVSDMLGPDGSPWAPGESVYVRVRGRADERRTRWTVHPVPVYWLRTPHAPQIEIVDNGDRTGTVKASWTSPEGASTPRGDAVRTRVWYAHTDDGSDPTEWTEIGVYDVEADGVVCDAAVPDGHVAVVRLEHITTEGADRPSSSVQASMQFAARGSIDIDTWLHAGDELDMSQCVLATTWHSAVADAMEVETQPVAAGAHPDWVGARRNTRIVDDFPAWVDNWAPGQDAWARARLLIDGTPASDWAVAPHPIRYLRTPDAPTLVVTDNGDGTGDIHATWTSPEDAATPRGHGVATRVWYAITDSDATPAGAEWIEMQRQGLEVADLLIAAGVEDGAYLHLRMSHATQEAEDRESDRIYAHALVDVAAVDPDPEPEPLLPPTDVVAISQGGAITISWRIAEQLGVRIEVSHNGGEYVHLDTIHPGEETAVLANVIDDDTYQFRVRHEDDVTGQVSDWVYTDPIVA